MIGCKTGFFENEWDLRSSYMKPYIFPRIVLVCLIKRAGVFGDQKDLVFMHLVLPVSDAENTFSPDYEVKDDPVSYKMLIGIKRFAFVSSEFIQVEIIRILIVYEFAKISSQKFLRHNILQSDTEIL